MTDGLMFIDIAEEEGDDKSILEILESFQSIEQSVVELEFSKMFTNKMDFASAYIEIQSGSGGTEAQDWAEMLLRMYTKWSEGQVLTLTVKFHMAMLPVLNLLHCMLA